jgi:hypothetical protein
MNGVATSVSAIAAAGMAGLALLAGQPLIAVMAFALAGACLGFLPHNYPRARIFMGDVGSLFLGFVLAGLAVLLAQEPRDWSSLLSPLLVLGLPLTDTALAMARRLGRSQDVLGGDREHIYDLLSRKGLGDTRTTGVMAMIACALGGASLWVSRLTSVLAWVVAALVSVVLVLLAARLGALGGALSSGRSSPMDRAPSALRRLVRRYGVAVLLDALVVVGSYYAALFLRVGYGLDFLGNAAEGQRYLSGLTAYLPFVVLTYLMVNGFLQLYSRVWEYASIAEGMSIVIASLVSSAGLLITDLLFGATRPIPLSVILMGGLLSMLGFVVLRYHEQLRSGITDWTTLFPAPEADVGAGNVLRAEPRPYDAETEKNQVRRRRTLIVGAQQHGQLLAAYMSKYRHAYLPVGFVDQDPNHHGMRVQGLKVLGDWQAIPDVVRRQKVDLVVLALSDADPETRAELVIRCLAADAEVKVLPNVYRDLITVTRPEMLAGVSI